MSDPRRATRRATLGDYGSQAVRGKRAATVHAILRDDGFLAPRRPRLLRAKERAHPAFASFEWCFADATYRRVVDNWDQRIKVIVSAASDYFESNFQIRFLLVGIEPWEYRGVARHPESRLKELLAISPGDADLLIGFIGFGEYLTGSDRAYFTGILGMGMPFGQHVMISGDDHFHLNRDKVVLMHELANVFGAFHVDNRRSLMYPIHTDVPTEILAEGKFELEPPLREVILAARELDFQRGVDSLDPETRRRIQTLARQYRHPREERSPTPIAMARVFQELRDNAQGSAGRPTGKQGEASQAQQTQNDVLQRGKGARHSRIHRTPSR